VIVFSAFFIVGKDISLVMVEVNVFLLEVVDFYRLEAFWTINRIKKNPFNLFSRFLVKGSVVFGRLPLYSLSLA